MAKRLFQKLGFYNGFGFEVFLRNCSQNLQHTPTSKSRVEILPSGPRPKERLPEVRKTPGSYAIQDKIPDYSEAERDELKNNQGIKITTIYRGATVQKISKVDIMHFENSLLNDRSKEGFIELIHNFRHKDKQSRGHLSFLYAAIKYIDHFGLQKELDVYNELLDVFPKYKFINKTLFDAIWAKPHPQIDCALDLLTLMEDNYVRPDDLTYTILLEVFGRASLPVQKANRMAFWFDKYRDINPYLLDEEDLKDKFKVCKFAMERITNDKENIKVYQPKQTPKETGLMNMQDQNNSPIESELYEDGDPFLISSQNQEQRDFISNFDPSSSLYVEGPFNIWMNNIKEQYFILRTGSLDIPNAETHEEETKVREGMILGVCITNVPPKNAMTMWMEYLKNDNPKIGDFNVIFNLDISENNLPITY